MRPLFIKRRNSVQIFDMSGVKLPYPMGFYSEQRQSKYFEYDHQCELQPNFIFPPSIIIGYVCWEYRQIPPVLAVLRAAFMEPLRRSVVIVAPRVVVPGVVVIVLLALVGRRAQRVLGAQGYGASELHGNAASIGRRDGMLLGWNVN
jgi:hypothetical protein